MGKDYEMGMKYVVVKTLRKNSSILVILKPINLKKKFLW